jgi:hypothetical protein
MTEVALAVRSFLEFFVHSTINKYMRFKKWLEVAGENNPAQIDKATFQATNKIMSSPDAADFRVDFSNASGSPSAQKQAFFDFGTKAMDTLPPKLANQTTPSHIFHQMQQNMGIKNPFVQEPSFMKKKMKKRMKK